MSVLVLAGACPEISRCRGNGCDYLAWFRGVVTTRTGVVYADELPMRQWPYRLFAQDWTYPALSALVRSAPGQAIVVTRNDYQQQSAVRSVVRDGADSLDRLFRLAR